jgi:hypothetical protein
MIVPHALSFPGVFAETGLLHAGPQTTAWIYAFWHTGFPLFVLGYALRPPRAAGTLSMRRCPGHDTFPCGLGPLRGPSPQGEGETVSCWALRASQ